VALVVKKDGEIVSASNSSNATSASHLAAIRMSISSRHAAAQGAVKSVHGIANHAVTAHLGAGNECALVQSVSGELARRNVLRR
jgi:hypothetical protein